MKQSKQLPQQDLLKSLSATVSWKRWIPESANSHILQLQHAVNDITCKHVQGSLWGWLMTTSVGINVSLLRWDYVCIEGER